MRNSGAGARRNSAGNAAAALYHRVSTLDQDPTLARGELRAAAKARSLTIALDLEETGSGARNDRPELQRLLAAVRAGDVRVVLVWKLDRFGRSALDLLANVRQLVDAGATFVATSQGLELGPNGGALSQLVFTTLAGVAEFEREQIRERTLLGLAAARERGVQLGRPPVAGPRADQVLELRRQNESWPAIAAALKCSIGKARRLAGRA